MSGGLGPGGPPGGSFAPGEYFLRMRGIPFTAREPDIIDFFQRAKSLSFLVCVCFLVVIFLCTLPFRWIWSASCDGLVIVRKSNAHTHVRIGC